MKLLKNISSNILIKTLCSVFILSLILVTLLGCNSQDDSTSIFDNAIINTRGDEYVIDGNFEIPDQMVEATVTDLINDNTPLVWAWTTETKDTKDTRNTGDEIIRGFIITQNGSAEAYLMGNRSLTLMEIDKYTPEEILNGIQSGSLNGITITPYGRNLSISEVSSIKNGEYAEVMTITDNDIGNAENPLDIEIVAYYDGDYIRGNILDNYNLLELIEFNDNPDGTYERETLTLISPYFIKFMHNEYFS